MTAPTNKVRDLTYQRDGHRCISCGAHIRLEWNHRASSGMGGRGSKAPILTPADGVTSCFLCNPAYESGMQERALANGWKIRKFTRVLAKDTPIYYPAESAWFLLNTDGTRDRLTQADADELRELAGMLPTLEGAK